MQRSCQASGFACVFQGLPGNARIPNFEVAQLIAHAQLMVSLELVPMAGPADALKIFTAVGIPSF
jgi:hypothetical protein